MAGASCCLPTISGISACHAGVVKAAAIPSWKVASSSSDWFNIPNQASTAMPAAVSRAPVCANRMSCRRFTRSAIAPAGRAKRNSGRLDIACISETIVGEPVSVVIVQTAAVSFIVVPMFETMLPSQSARKSGRRSGEAAADIAATLETIGRMSPLGTHGPFLNLC